MCQISRSNSSRLKSSSGLDERRVPVAIPITPISAHRILFVESFLKSSLVSIGSTISGFDDRTTYLRKLARYFTGSVEETKVSRDCEIS